MVHSPTGPYPIWFAKDTIPDYISPRTPIGCLTRRVRWTDTLGADLLLELEMGQFDGIDPGPVETSAPMQMGSRGPSA